MKTHVLFLFLFFSYCQCNGQEEQCDKTTTLQIFDSRGNQKTGSICEGEEIYFKPVSRFNNHYWFLNNKKTSITDSTYKIVAGSQSFSIDYYGFNDTDQCFTTATKFVSILPTRRQIFMPDSAMLNQDVTISFESYQTGDMLKMPNSQIPINSYSVSLGININENSFGSYELVNASIKEQCGSLMPEIKKSLFQTTNTNQNYFRISSPSATQKACNQDFTIIKIDSAWFNVKNPNYVLEYSYNAVSFTELNKITFENDTASFNKSLAPYYRLVEKNSNTISNIIGPFSIKQECPVKSISLKEVVAQIATANQCKGQKTLFVLFSSAYFDYSYYSKIQVSQAIWRRDKQIVQNSTSLVFFAKTPGTYTCELIFERDTLKTLAYKVDTFASEASKLNYVWGDMNYQYLNFCRNYERNDEMFFNSIYHITPIQGANFRFSGFWLRDEQIVKNWYINGEMQDNHEAILPFIDKANLNLLLQIKAGECSFTSSEYKVNVSKNAKVKLKEIYICKGDTLNYWSDKGNPINGDYARYSWYKDGKPYYNFIYTFGAQPIWEKDVSFYEEGIYHLVKSNLLGSDCSIIADSVKVIYKNKIIIDWNPEIDFCNKEAQFQVITNSISPYLGPSYQIPFKDIKLIKDGQDQTASNLTKSSNSTVYSDSYYFKLQSPGYYQIQLTKDITDCVYESEVKYLDDSLKIEMQIGGCYLYLNRSNYNPNIYTPTFIHDGANIGNVSRIFEDGNYQMIAWNRDSSCVVKSNILKVKLPKPNTNLSNLDSLKLCEGKVVSIAMADSLKNEVVYWQKDDTLLEANYKKQALQVKDKGTYKAIFRYGNCDHLESSDALLVMNSPSPTATISGSKNINYGQATELKIDLTGEAPWYLRLSSTEEFWVEASPYKLQVRPIEDSKYTINYVKNICGLGSVAGEALVKVIVLAQEPVTLQNVSVYPNPVAEYLLIEGQEADALVGLEIINELGQKVPISFEVIEKNKMKVDISQLVTGSYYLKAKHPKGMLNRKIIKQK